LTQPKAYVDGLSTVAGRSRGPTPDRFHQFGYSHTVDARRQSLEFTLKHRLCVSTTAPPSTRWAVATPSEWKRIIQVIRASRGEYM